MAIKLHQIKLLWKIFLHYSHLSVKEAFALAKRKQKPRHVHLLQAGKAARIISLKSEFLPSWSSPLTVNHIRMILLWHSWVLVGERDSQVSHINEL